MAAMGLAFLIMAMLVQAAMLTVARSAADAATTQAARRVAVLGSAPGVVEAELKELLLATVPGAGEPETNVADTEGEVVVTSRLRWRPPGPDLFELWITTESTATRASSP